MTLKFAYEEDGNCRVVYSRKVEEMKALYCWQEEARGEFKFYRCSQDGEPSYEVTGYGGIKAIDLTPPCPGLTSVGRDLNKFLNQAVNAIV